MKGFRRIHLEARQARVVTFELGPDDLRMFGGEMRWVVEPGMFRVLVASSSKDIRLRGEVTVR